MKCIWNDNKYYINMISRYQYLSLNEYYYTILPSLFFFYSFQWNDGTPFDFEMWDSVKYAQYVFGLPTGKRRCSVFNGIVNLFADTVIYKFPRNIELY